MTAKDLFTIILKVVGILTIKDVLVSIPSLLAVVSEFHSYDKENAILAPLFVLIPIGFYLAVVYLLLFRTEQIISNLKLESNLTKGPLLYNMHRSSLLSIAIIISGILLICWAIPSLIRNLYYWYEYNKYSGGIMSTSTHDFGQIFLYLSQIIIGLLLLGNQRMLINFIERKRKTSRDT